MSKVQLICMSFDGDYVAEHNRFNPDGFDSIEEANDHAADMGSKWFFYPFCFVTSASGLTIVDTPPLLSHLKGKRVKTIARLFKQFSALPDNQGVDCEVYTIRLHFLGFVPYIRKTEDTWDIEQYTAEGWEVVNTETTRQDAKRSIREYRENQPGSYRIKYHRVKIAQ